MRLPVRKRGGDGASRRPARGYGARAQGRHSVHGLRATRPSPPAAMANLETTLRAAASVGASLGTETRAALATSLPLKVRAVRCGARAGSARGRAACEREGV